MRTGKWRPGALRMAIVAELGAKTTGLTASDLARRTGWSESSVRRELDMMEQLKLARRATPDRTALWFPTKAGEILWLLDREGEQKTYVLALSLSMSLEAVHAEAARLVQLGLVRGRVDGLHQAWRLAGKAAR